MRTETLPAKTSRFEITPLEERVAPAVAVAGGLVAIAAAIDRIDVNIPIDVNVENNTICVNVAAINSAAGC